MDVRDYLSDDGQALLALCSQLAVPEESAAAGPAPFKLSEWNHMPREKRSSSASASRPARPKR